MASALMAFIGTGRGARTAFVDEASVTELAYTPHTKRGSGAQKQRSRGDRNSCKTLCDANNTLPLRTPTADLASHGPNLTP